MLNPGPTPKKTRAKKEKVKAGNGQGSIRELPSGKWRWEVTLGYTLEGKRQSVSGVCANQTQAGIEKAKALADFARGLLASADKITLVEYSERWLKRQKGLRASSISSYQGEIAHAMKHLGKLKLKDVKPHHIKDCLAKLSDTLMNPTGKPMASRTLGKVRTRLKAIFREAVNDQIIYVNPCDGVKTIRQPTPEPVGIALDEVQMTRLHELGLTLYEAGVSRLFPAIFMGASLGLRRGEVMGLKWEDIDFARNVIRLRRSLSVNNGKPDMGDLKTRHSKRDIPLPLSLKNLLLLHQEKQKLERKNAEGAWNETRAIFATTTGEFTHPDNLNRAVTRLCAWSNADVLTNDMLLVIPVKARARLKVVIQAGERLPDLKPHDLRHTAATLMLRRKVPVEVVSRILGHARVSITLDIYRHVLESEKHTTMPDLFDTPLPVRELPQVTLN
jgi:integrase